MVSIYSPSRQETKKLRGNCMILPLEVLKNQIEGVTLPSVSLSHYSLSNFWAMALAKPSEKGGLSAVIIRPSTVK